ncbi:MAG: glycoside hydrolase family 2 protein [Promethearchaeota archaeon]
MEVSLNGIWKFRVDEENQGIKEGWWNLDWISKEYEKLEQIEIPNNWNAIKGLENYEGIVWFFYKLPQIQEELLSKDIYVEFKGVNYHTIAWLDSYQLGENNGGFLPFKFSVNSGLFLIEQEHYLAVRVENFRKKDRIPCESFDWFNWGGIYRDVKLLFEEKLRIDWIGIKPKILPNNNAQLIILYEIIDTRDKELGFEEYEGKMDWNIYYIGNYSKKHHQNKANYNDLEVKFKKEQDKQNISIDIQNEEIIIPKELEDIDISFKEANDITNKEEQKSFKEMDIIDDLLREPLTKSDFKNLNIKEEQSEIPVDWALIKSGEVEVKKGCLRGQFSCIIEDPKLWDIDTPELYLIEIGLGKTDSKKSVRFGIREISAKEHHIFLNHKPIRIKGISLHEELLPYGRAIPSQKRREDILNIKALGLNAIRTGHYPHDESFYQIADEEGILVFEEIPVYWNIQFNNREVYKIAYKMLKTMIKRDFNRPSIILWSCGNEIPIGSNFACLQFMNGLIKFAKNLDDSRLVSWSSLPTFTKIPRKIKKYTDVFNMNIYLGWYYLSTKNLNFFLDVIHHLNKKKPIIISEFGAAAKYGYHVDIKKFEKFSEERQASVIAHQIKILNSKDYVSGWFIWIYRDFKSHLRLNKYQRGFNRKGIISEKGEKKLIAKLLPYIVNSKFDLNTIKNHRLSAPIVGRLYWPLFKLVSIIFSSFTNIINFLQRKNKFYTNKRE